MPNILTTIFTSTPASEPVESPHPNTGVYVLGTQLGNGTWQVVHTLVTKTSTPPTMSGRLKNYPAATATVVASGNVLNNILATPTGLSAITTSPSTNSLAVSSNPNATAYRLLSATTAGGTYSQIYQGAAAGFAHTGLASSTTYYYQWQYVGSGYYDDSPLSGVFSGVTAAANTRPNYLSGAGSVILTGQYLTTVNGVTTSSSGSPYGGYGSTGTIDYKVAAGTSAVFGFRTVSASDCDAVIGFKLAASAAGYANMQAGVWNSAPDPTRPNRFLASIIIGNAYVTSTTPVRIGDFVICRATYTAGNNTTTITGEVSTDGGTTWTVLRTLGTVPGTSDLFCVVDMSGQGQVSALQGGGLTLI